MSKSRNRRTITARALARARRVFGLKEMSVEKAVANGQVVTHLYRGIDINWLITNPDDEIQRVQIDEIFYERGELQEILTRLGHANCILDIGSNIGNHAIFFERMYRPDTIILVEPQQLAIKHLLANIALNYSPAYDLSYLGMALSGGQGKATITDPSRYNIGISRILEDGAGDVPLISGDEIVRDRRVDLIKIDVEGMEYHVLEGLENTLRRSSPLLFIEVCDQERAKVDSFLAGLSYTLVFESQMYEGIKNCMFERGD